MRHCVPLQWDGAHRAAAQKGVPQPATAACCSLSSLQGNRAFQQGSMAPATMAMHEQTMALSKL